MSIPAGAIIKWELLYLLHEAPNTGFPVQQVYVALAKKFPELTTDDLTIPHKSDKTGSKWKTEVRSIRNVCKDEGLISRETKRGFWALTEKGHEIVLTPIVVPGLN